jgi:hypothetical protein
MQKETSMFTDLQKGAAQAIVNVFKTDAPQGDYASVTLLKGDTGHLTYGRSQTTLASGNLYLLINVDQGLCRHGRRGLCHGVTALSFPA